ncbi:MAG TPA: sigma 54-interacting transcriptional regulator [Clostridia bacterium]|nr:sigma 54-interacting transcriptional regulator [Clostridia bacterium]
MRVKNKSPLFLQKINQSVLRFLGLNFGIIAVDKDCLVLDINKIAEEYLGFQSEAVIYKKLDSNFFYPCLKKTMTTGEMSVKKEVINGNILKVTFLPINDETGVIGALVILENISEWEKKLEMIELLDKQLDKLLDSIYDGIVISDARGYILKVNKAYEFLAGITKEEFVGKHIDTLTNEGYFKKSMTARVIATKKSDSMMQELGKSGRIALISGMPVFNDKNELWRVIVTVRDMSELEKIKAKLENVKSENISLRKELSFDQVTYSEKMNKILNLGKTVAKTDITVLITGESGVGKDVLARYIHEQSSRKEYPFISINCGAIPENLLESELFGYEKGAFTGAEAKGKKGLLDMAQKGTFVFDEVGDLPLSLQGKLLGLLQDKEFYRVGGTEPIHADIRFIACTNKDLDAMVEQGLFRADLFYRLNIVNINIPPLRERKEEITPLIWIFLKKFNKKYNKNKRIDQSLIDLLNKYDWPGNIRELQNVIERLVVISTSDLITEEFLPSYMMDLIKDAKKEENCQAGLEEILNKVEKEMLIKAYRQGGNTRTAAKILGISQSSMVKKMKKHNLDYKDMKVLSKVQKNSCS